MATMMMTQGRTAPDATDVRIRLEVLAWRAGARDDAQLAARLFGAVEGMCGATEESAPLIGAEYSRSRAAVQTGLADRRFEEAWVEGWRLSPEQALAYASEKRVEGEGRGR